MGTDNSALDRLNLLLPWLNADHSSVAVRMNYDAIRSALKEFIASFDGSSGALHVVAEPFAPLSEDRYAYEQLDRPEGKVEGLTDDDVDYLEFALRYLIEEGFKTPADRAAKLAADDEATRQLEKQGIVTTIPMTPQEHALPLSSLRFSVRSACRPKLKRSVTKSGKSYVEGGPDAVRRYKGAGAYVLHVYGPVRELIPFLVGQLLTAPGMVDVRQCETPGCSGLLVVGSKRGPKNRFCSIPCREANRESERRNPGKKKKRKK